MLEKTRIPIKRIKLVFATSQLSM